jgi:4-hydroxy-3-polyprenylbenzoate decarboxylase
MAQFVVGVTGASGGPCARNFIRGILSCREVERIHLVISRFAHQSLRAELGTIPDGDEDLLRALCGGISERIVLHAPEDMAAPISSGSFPAGGMIVIPCSMGTLGAIASGASRNLIHRCADVTLKERRPLLLAVREAPLNRIHLANLVTACEAGAIIFPLVPSFYTLPSTVEEILEQFTARILDQLRLSHGLGRRWRV